MAVEIYIARHGQNEDNINGILNGHRDLPLTELGIRQAEQLAEGILEAQLNFDHIFSSPLQRAYKTAEIIAEKLGHTDTPEVLQSLIERDFGTASGKPIAEVVASAGDNVIKTNTITYILDFENGEPFPKVLKKSRIYARLCTPKILKWKRSTCLSWRHWKNAIRCCHWKRLERCTSTFSFR